MGLNLHSTATFTTTLKKRAGSSGPDQGQLRYKGKIGDEPTGQEYPELLTLKHTHGHDMTIANGVGRIGWMTG